ncbi:MAG: hypothetical protein ACI9H9_002713 [Pseudoalteromonas tetraodonis]|jgi:hypothetical protein
MPNSVVAALAHPVLHGIRIPIHQTKQPEGEPCTRSPRHKDSVAFAMWLSTAVGTTTFYCVAHRLQIQASPTQKSRAFLHLE